MRFHWGTTLVPTILPFEALMSSPTWNDYNAVISFGTLSSGFSSAWLVTFHSSEHFQFPYDSASRIWINTVFFSSFSFGLTLHLFFLLSKTNLKAFSSKDNTFKTLNCILFHTVLDWCVLFCHITLGNACLLALQQWRSKWEWWTELNGKH